MDKIAQIVHARFAVAVASALAAGLLAVPSPADASAATAATSSPFASTSTAAGAAIPRPITPLWPANRAFRATRVTVVGKPRAIVAGTAVIVSFGKRNTTNPSAGELGAYAGCNRMFGSGRLAAGRLIIKNLASTKMACGAARDKQESWVSALLTSSPQYLLAGTRLTLRQGPLEVRFVQAPRMRPRIS
jgi:heat shock protein HslJ